MAASSPNRFQRQAAWLALATAVMLGGGLFAFRGGHHYAPADVSPQHAAQAKACEACHEPWHGPSGQRCLACHRTWPNGAVERLHEVTGQQGTRCWGCHTEHSGGRLTRAFDHGLLPPADRQACAQCHEAPGDTLHTGRSTGCGQCHRTSAWRPAEFDHTAQFPLTGPHQAPCATCHPQGTAAYTCYGCHEHEPARIAAKHREEGISDWANCVACHRGGGEGEHGEGGGGGRRPDGDHEGGDD